METHGQYPITLVTAYFDVGVKPEYPENPYPGWVRNFLPYVRWPLVIFCDEQSVDMLKEARGDKPAVWHVTCLEEFFTYKYMDYLRAQQRDIPSPEVALIWHEKHHFLRQTLSENPFGSEMVFWCDIGSLRGRMKSRLRAIRYPFFHLFEDIEWPNPGVCRALPQDRVFLIPDHGPRIGSVQVSGNFFGGGLKPARRWCDAYSRFLDKAWQDGEMQYIHSVGMCQLCIRQPEIAYLLSADIAWLRFGRRLSWLLRRGGKVLPASDYLWYLLSGERFPWKYYRRIIVSGMGS